MPLSTLDTSLVDKLVPTVDRLRSTLLPKMGTRAYAVSIVVRAWSGGQVGEGTVSFISQIDLDPPPLVNWEGRAFVLDPMRGCGLTEVGECMLAEISLTLTEAELLGTADGGLGPARECYYRISDAHGQEIRPTFWVLAAPPTPDRERGIGWMVKLRKYEAQEAA